jgi:hypothetical protein
MNTPSFTVDVVFQFCEEEEIYEDLMANFLIKTSGLTCKLSFEDFSATKISDIETLVHRVTNPDENETCHTLTFCDCNGYVGITVDNDIVTFTTSKSGAGGDGNFVIEVDRQACIPAFEKLLAKIKELPSDGSKKETDDQFLNDMINKIISN